MPNLDEDKRVVLKAINRVRAKAGLGRINKLRRGVPKHAGACPVAMSLEGTGVSHVSRYAVWTRREVDDHNWGELGFTAGEAAAVARIITAIDSGKLPELEIPKTPVKIRFPGNRKATVIE